MAVARSVALFAAAVWLGGACSGDATGSTTARLEIIAGGEITDTIGAVPPQGLVVRLDRGWQPPAGVRVEFATAFGPCDDYFTMCVRAYLAPAGSISYATMAGGTTDAQGRVAMGVKLGVGAGVAVIRVTVPAYGLSDSARVRVLPGRATLYSVLPADTAIYTGVSYALRAYAVDRGGNRWDTTATYGAPTPGMTVSPAGVVTGAALGRDSVSVQVGGWSGFARASIVPTGTIAAHARRAFVDDPIGVVVVELDGSGWKRVAVETPPRTYGIEDPPEHEMPPRWNPVAPGLVYHEDSARVGGNVAGFGIKHILLTDLVSPPRRLFPNSFFVTEQEPDYSPDGQWIYFSGRYAADYNQYIWRVHPDGSALERVTSATGTSKEVRPSVSPDGGSIAYVVAGSYGPAHLRVLNLRTAAITDFTSQGTSPRWSPDGAWIAYVETYDHSGYSGPLHVVRADGSGDRVLSTVALSPVLDWSPDGRFIIGAEGYSGLVLIEVATGKSIPLPFSGQLDDPAWRR